MTPSVSAEELRHYEHLRAQFSSLHPQAKSPSSSSSGGRGGRGSGGGGGGSGESAARPPTGGNGGDEGAMEAVWSSLGQGQGSEEEEGKAGRV